MESLNALPTQPERPLTRQEVGDALAKRKRGIHMMKDAIKLRALRDDYESFKEFCTNDKERLNGELDRATDKLDRLAVAAEIKACDKSMMSADDALTAIQARADQLLGSE